MPAQQAIDAILSRVDLLLLALFPAAAAFCVVLWAMEKWITGIRPMPRHRPSYVRPQLTLRDATRFSQKRFRHLTRGDVACIVFFERLDEALSLSQFESAPRMHWTEYLPEFRRLARDRPVQGLLWTLPRVSTDLQRLVVWLLARCHNTQAIARIAPLRIDPSRKLRCEVARALDHLGARGELEVVAEHDPDPWIRDYAAPRARRSFATRLGQFVADEVQTGRPLPADWRSPMPLLVTVPLDERHGPKPVSLIRRILEHIRLVLRGSSA
jgi:hypothetical protein